MSSPLTVHISRASQNAIPNHYLVRLKEHVDLDSHLSWLQQQKLKYDDGSSKCEVIYKHSRINGYAAVLIGPVLEDLTKRDDVKSITEDRQATW